MKVFVISTMGSYSPCLEGVYALIGWKLVLLQELFESWCLVEGSQKVFSLCDHSGVFRLT